MAIVCSTRFLKCTPRLIFLRLLKQGSAQFSNSLLLSAKNSDPVKYTSNTAAGVRIAQTLGLENPQTEDAISKYIRRVIAGSMAIFLLYFCVFREENDIDEMLRGNPEFFTETQQLIDLKMKLKFCEQNNLPRDAIRAKIEEIESRRPSTSPYIK